MSNSNEMVTKLRAGERRALARAITLTESGREEDRKAAQTLLTEILPEAGNSIRLGISGIPGVGKSTFIESFGLHVIEQGRRVAVLAIDPSSTRSGGSILGDKTRMPELSAHPDAFIRPSPTGGSLGGVARRTREALLLCEAAGYDVIIVETVGVGQSETEVADMVDMFLLLLLPGGGDELQGIKRGIMELADLILVNKADGDLLPKAKIAQAEYQSALRLLTPPDQPWQPKVLLCSALEKTGLEDVWKEIGSFRQTQQESGAFDQRRRDQAVRWMWKEIREGLLQLITSHPELSPQINALEAEVAAGRTSPTEAARKILEKLAA